MLRKSFEEDKNPGALYYMGMDYATAKQFPESNGCLELVLRISGLDLSSKWCTLIRLASNYFTLGLIDDAEKHALSSLQIYPDRAEMFFLLGDACKHRGLWAAAESWYTRVLDLSFPENAMEKISRTLYEPALVAKAIANCTTQRIQHEHRRNGQAAFDSSTSEHRAENVGAAP